MSEVGEDGKIQNGFVTYDKNELMGYLAERHRQGEYLDLIKVSSTQAGLLDEKNNVGIVYVLTREAGDLAPGLGGPARIAVGKGAVNCESRQIFAWSMEMRVGEERTPKTGGRLVVRRSPGLAAGQGRGRVRLNRG